MKRIFTLFITVTMCLVSRAQHEDIKKLVFEDLLFLNELYNGCLLQNDQTSYVINGKDTVKNINTIDDINVEFENRVSIVHIDSTLGYYFVEIKFLIIPKSPFVNLFTENSFSYLLYRSNNTLLKINGFVTSEIFYVDDFPSVFVRNLGGINTYNRVRKLWVKRNVQKIEKYLFISVLKKLHESGYYIDYHPYIVDEICLTGM